MVLCLLLVSGALWPVSYSFAASEAASSKAPLSPEAASEATYGTTKPIDPSATTTPSVDDADNVIVTTPSTEPTPPTTPVEPAIPSVQMCIRDRVRGVLREEQREAGPEDEGGVSGRALRSRRQRRRYRWVLGWPTRRNASMPGGRLVASTDAIGVTMPAETVVPPRFRTPEPRLRLHAAFALSLIHISTACPRPTSRRRSPSPRTARWCSPARRGTGGRFSLRGRRVRTRA